MRLEKKIQPLLAVLFPPRCPVCGEIKLPYEGNTCIHCYHRLPFLKEPTCLCCGRELMDATREYCDACEKETHFFTRNFAVFSYDQVMKSSIASFKYRDRTEYAAFYSEFMAGRFGKVLEQLSVELLVPVPVSGKRERNRGFNQAELLTKELTKRLSIAAFPALVRQKDTKPQNSLSRTERKANLSDAISIRKDYIEGKKRLPKRVAVIDDIFTTGSTMDSCAKVLRENGAEQVFGLCVCIGRP